MTHLEAIWCISVALIGGTIVVLIASVNTPKGADW